MDPSADNHPYMLFEVGKTLLIESQSKRCSYDGSDCYSSKSLASIDSISATSGYTTGGQILTIEGHGFIFDDVSININGVTCNVKTLERTKITCETQAASGATTSGNYKGQGGLRVKVYSSTNGYNLNTMSNLPYYQELALHAESF